MEHEKNPSVPSERVSQILRRRNFLRGLALAAGGGALAVLSTRRAQAQGDENIQSCPQKYNCDKPINCSEPFTCSKAAYTCSPDYKASAEEEAAG